MNKRYLLLVSTFILLVTVTGNASAQTNKTLAAQKTEEAIRLMDKEQKYDEAIILLNEATLLDPGNLSYPYEIAYAHLAKKDYKSAVDVLETLTGHKEVRSQVFQALGNAYDYLGKPDVAIATYERGLAKFPNAGELYLEMGNMQMSSQKYNEALDYYEKGIMYDPEFPSNYYWAAKLFCSSDEEVWGMLYGELFMNLERNTDRTAEISKMLYDTYNSEIKFENDTSSTVSFSQNHTLTLEDIKDTANFKLPFGMMYEGLLAMSVAVEKSIDLTSLHRIRKRFIDFYFKDDFPVKYPNVLFEYQKTLDKLGHLEAYNHWILMKGDEKEFDRWEKENEAKWEAFVKWFENNQLGISAKNQFHRTKY